MTIQGTPVPPTVPMGRERSCVQCSTTYRAPRSTARYCSDRCRKRSQRGAEETNDKTLDLLRRWLFHCSYAGKIAPVNRRDPRPPVYAMSVPYAHALSEWNTWNPGASMTDTAFVAALKQLDIHGPDYVLPHKRS